MAMMHPLTQMPVWIPGWMQPWLCQKSILNGKTILITIDYYSISSIRNHNFGIPEDLGIIIRNPLQNTYIRWHQNRQNKISPSDPSSGIAYSWWFAPWKASPLFVAPRSHGASPLLSPVQSAAQLQQAMWQQENVAWWFSGDDWFFFRFNVVVTFCNYLII